MHHIAELYVLKDGKKIIRREIADPRRANKPVAVHVVSQQEQPVPGILYGRNDL